MRRRRSSMLPVSSLIPPVASVAAWGWLREPMHLQGLLGLSAAGVLLGVLLPGFLVSAEALPLLLIPSRARVWWRHGQDHRPGIPVRLRRAVYAADGYRCAWCHSTEQLQVDHIRPWTAGGLTALWNMMTLCGTCNRLKSNYWVRRDGSVLYTPFHGFSHEHEAGQILRFELRHRWWPGRWIRAGWSLL